MINKSKIFRLFWKFAIITCYTLRKANKWQSIKSAVDFVTLNYMIWNYCIFSSILNRVSCSTCLFYDKLVLINMINGIIPFKKVNLKRFIIWQQLQAMLTAFYYATTGENKGSQHRTQEWLMRSFNVCVCVLGRWGLCNLVVRLA